MLLLAVIDFLHDGEEPDLDGISEGMFMMIRPTLENSRTRSEAGRRGGKLEFWLIMVKRCLFWR